SAEELLERVRLEDPKISQATVYRTLRLLTECGLAEARNFGDGQTRYEIASDEHHDHLICTECGRIEEFEDPEIEALQEKVARAHALEMPYHRLELYRGCRERRAKEDERSSATTAPVRRRRVECVADSWCWPPRFARRPTPGVGDALYHPATDGRRCRGRSFV